MAEVEFTDNSAQVKEALDEACVAWLHEAGGEIEARAKRNTPVDTGQLKGSWRHIVSTAKMETVIGSTLENAIWNELGTGEYALNGDGRKTPWYVPVDGYMGTKKPTYQGKVTVVYGKNGKKFFKTDGKRPQRSLFNAMNTLKSKLQSSLKNKLKGIGK